MTFETYEDASKHCPVYALEHRLFGPVVVITEKPVAVYSIAQKATTYYVPDDDIYAKTIFAVCTEDKLMLAGLWPDPKFIACMKKRGIETIGLSVETFIHEFSLRL